MSIAMPSAVDAETWHYSISGGSMTMIEHMVRSASEQRTCIERDEHTSRSWPKDLTRDTRWPRALRTRASEHYRWNPNSLVSETTAALQLDTQAAGSKARSKAMDLNYCVLECLRRGPGNSALQLNTMLELYIQKFQCRGPLRLIVAALCRLFEPCLLRTILKSE